MRLLFSADGSDEPIPGAIETQCEACGKRLWISAVYAPILTMSHSENINVRLRCDSCVDPAPDGVEEVQIESLSRTQIGAVATFLREN